MSTDELPPKTNMPDVTTVTFELTDETLHAINLPPSEVGMELRLAAAMKFYELGRLSSGAAAILAGIPRVDFLTRLGEYGVNAFDYTEEELAREIENARGRPQ